HFLRGRNRLGPALGSEPDDRGSPASVEHVLTRHDLRYMMSNTTTTTAPKRTRALPPLMSLTDAAAERLRRLYETGGHGKKLRIGVRTKGCSGLSYDMTWVEATGPGDEVVT